MNNLSQETARIAFEKEMRFTGYGTVQLYIPLKLKLTQ